MGVRFVIRAEIFAGLIVINYFQKDIIQIKTVCK
jgi:hypothetical protein